MGKINQVRKLTDNAYLNLYNVKATSIHNTPVDYFVASRAKSEKEMKLSTGENPPDGVIIYSLYGEKKDKVVLIRQYRYPIGTYAYEFPAGLVEKGEDYHDSAVRELYEETGLTLTPLKVDEAYQKPYFTSVGMSDESCAAVYGYASGTVSADCPGGFRGDPGGACGPGRSKKNPPGRKGIHHVCVYADAFFEG